MLPMGRRTRRARQRRLAGRPVAVAPERAAASAPARETIRPRFGRAPLTASGQPSAALLRAAEAEYGYVVKDLRRIGLVVGATVLALALTAVGVNVLLR